MVVDGGESWVLQVDCRAVWHQRCGTWQDLLLQILFQYELRCAFTLLKISACLSVQLGREGEKSQGCLLFGCPRRKLPRQNVNTVRRAGDLTADPPRDLSPLVLLDLPIWLWPCLHLSAEGDSAKERSEWMSSWSFAWAVGSIHHHPSFPFLLHSLGHVIQYVWPSLSTTEKEGGFQPYQPL